MKRREFLKAALAAGVFPSIVPARVLGADAPSNKLQIALIGCGRVASTMDLQGLAANHDIAMLTTLCDVDAERLPFFKQLAANQYGYYKKNVDHVKLEMDYRKVLDDPGVDGVMVCTQDHWHARMVVEACLKGKDVYVQKPMAFSVAESEAIVEAVRRTKRVFHIGTQQRTDKGIGLGFRRGVEYVLSGRLGKLDHIEVGIVDNSPKFEDPFPVNERMPDPRDFNFDLWLGPARDDVSYSQLRTHWRIREPNGSLPLVGRHGRYMNNGWLQIQDYCMGNICGWGSHHVDIAQWAMQNAAPISVKCEHVEFLKGRLFNVHDNCIISYKYANGVEMRLGTPRYSGFPCGCKFYGANGDWIWTSRGTTGRPVEKRVDTAYKPKAAFWRPCESNKKELIEGEPTTQVKRVTTNHHRPWFEAMRTRTDTHITVEEANVSTISCILGYIAMNEAGRTIGWDPVKRCFTNPDDQKRLYTRFARPQFSAIEALKEIRKRG
ncbi:MAG: Gfo/Idh/MocA family oxidoreductase [Kiritimatiellae bacterium]|nr:Gfo/Idh/MocA family oxidoreductase [Kiritimatiellia bacterium]